VRHSSWKIHDYILSSTPKVSRLPVDLFYCQIFISKVKVKMSLYLTKHHAMKKYLGTTGIAPRVLNLGTRWR
jgi:hypothetical protein